MDSIASKATELIIKIVKLATMFVPINKLYWTNATVWPAKNNISELINIINRTSIIKPKVMLIIPKIKLKNWGYLRRIL